MKGKGNSINYKYRMHDPRIGRFFAVDPLAAKYSFNSPYCFSENRVINRIELEGAESYIPEELTIQYWNGWWNNKGQYEVAKAKPYVMGAGVVVGVVVTVIIDIAVTKGACTKAFLSSVAQQYAVGVIGEVIDDGMQLSDFRDGLNAVDLFDAGVETILRNNESLDAKLFSDLIGSSTDISLEGDFSTVLDGSKSQKDMNIDLFFNLTGNLIGLSNASFAKIGNKVYDVTSPEFAQALKESEINSVQFSITVVQTEPQVLNDKKCLVQSKPEAQTLQTVDINEYLENDHPLRNVTFDVQSEKDNPTYKGTVGRTVNANEVDIDIKKLPSRGEVMKKVHEKKRSNNP